MEAMKAMEAVGTGSKSELLHTHLHRWEDDGGPVAPALPALDGDSNGEMPDDLKHGNVIGGQIGSHEGPWEDAPPGPEGSAASMPRDAMEFAPVLRFRFGAAVQASDGAAGTLSAVTVEALRDEPRWTVTHLGIRMGMFHPHLAFIPMDLVGEAIPGAVRLNIGQATMNELARPAAMPPGIALTRSTRVAIRGGAAGTRRGKRLGRLVHLTMHQETRTLHHLVAARRLRGAVLVLASVMTAISAQQITVRLGSTVPSPPTHFRPDEALRQDVYARLYDYSPLRVDLPGIDIRPLDGAVWLRGYVSSDGKRRLAGNQVRGLAGMTELHNELVADNELAVAVSMALARDQRTAGQHIGVYPQLGEIYLRGSVRTRAAREGASAVAAAVHTVKRVVNTLRIDPSAAGIPVLAGVTNEEDCVPGGR